MTQTLSSGLTSAGMQSPQTTAPKSVKVARVLVFVEAFLAAQLGLLVLVAGTIVLGQAGGSAEVFVVAIAMIVFVLAGLWVWAGIAIGRLNNAARWTVVGIATAGCLVELVRLGATPVRSIIAIAL